MVLWAKARVFMAVNFEGIADSETAVRKPVGPSPSFPDGNVSQD